MTSIAFLKYVGRIFSPNEKRWSGTDYDKTQTHFSLGFPFSLYLPLAAGGAQYVKYSLFPKWVYGLNYTLDILSIAPWI